MNFEHVCLCLSVYLFVLFHICVCSCLCLFVYLRVESTIQFKLLRNMKGAREQLLDIESKTQYQPSRWSSVANVHTAREPKLHWLAEVRSL